MNSLDVCDISEFCQNWMVSDEVFHEKKENFHLWCMVNWAEYENGLYGMSIENMQP